MLYFMVRYISYSDFLGNLRVLYLLKSSYCLAPQVSSYPWCMYQLNYGLVFKNTM